MEQNPLYIVISMKLVKSNNDSLLDEVPKSSSSLSKAFILISDIQNNLKDENQYSLK
jgi:hypothetical protein